MDASDIAQLAALHAAIDEAGPDVGRGIDSGHGALALALGWMRAGRDDRAAAYLKTAAATLTPACAPAWIAQWHLRAGQPEAALQILAGQPRTPATAALRNLAAGYAADGSDALAGPDGGEGDAALYWWAVAHAHWRRDGSGTAVYDALVRAIHAAPWRLDWRFELAGALFAGGPAATAALAGYWLNLPGGFPASRRWLLLNCYAHILAIGHRDRAVACARTAVVLDPADPRPYRACAQALADYAALDQVEAGFAAFWQGRKPATLPLSPTAHAALRLAQRAVTLCPDGVAWNDLGAVAFAAGAMTTAADAFAQALAVEPGQRHAQINYVVALVCLERPQEAARFIAETTFAAALPKSLLGLSDPAGLWPTLPDYQEWRRGVVFSQTWWRELGWRELGWRELGDTP
jgi:tetratricopeptide (TPR) repeat protein